MTITLDQVLPHPLREMEIGPSEIWQQASVALLPGSINEVVAASGRGKSSFLAFIFGLRSDFDGDIRIEGKAISNWSKAELTQARKHSLSLVFQGLELFPELTGLANIELKNRLTCHLSNERIQYMAEQLEVQPFLHQQASTLSFGQRQRIALIRALAQPFQWLLLDEPFSHLDPDLRSKAWDLIREEASNRNAGVILTSLAASNLPGITKTYQL